MPEEIDTMDYTGPERRVTDSRIMVPFRSVLVWSLIAIIGFNVLFMSVFFLDQRNRSNRSSMIASQLVTVQEQQQCVADAQSRWDAAIGDIISIQFNDPTLPIDAQTRQALEALKKVNDELKQKQVAACYEIPTPKTGD